MYIKRMLKVVLFFILVSVAGSCIKKEKIPHLVIWHWMVDRQSAFQALAEKYESETGVKVDFKLFFPPDIYSQKVIAAARAGNLPDIFGILGEKRMLASFVKAGHILDLTPSMKENNDAWRKRFYPQTLRIVSFPPNNIYEVPSGIYGVPIDTTVLQFLYNKSLFREAGLDPQSPPKSFDNLISYAQQAKSKLGIDGFVCGWAESWLLNALATEWAINLMGEEKFLKTLKGDVPYTDEDWIKVFSLFAKLKESGILAPNITAMTNKEAEDAFAKSKAVFSFNGSWAVNVYRQLNPKLEYAFFSLPQVSSSFPIKVWGGAGSSFMVNTHSPYKDKAVKFLKWLTLPEQQKFLIEATNNLPAIKGCEDSLPPLLKSLTESFSILTHPDIWPYNEDSRVIEVMNRGLQQIVMGLKTPLEVAKEIQITKERLSQR
ncbi:MAG: extracellular solute-binding protein [Candidatus Omnitrophica bacterium]|nr:extracellular solute-binding protein [Candidatus Omnitrophota bacterium]